MICFDRAMLRPCRTAKIATTALSGNIGLLAAILLTVVGVASLLSKGFRLGLRKLRSVPRHEL